MEVTVLTPMAVAAKLVRAKLNPVEVMDRTMVMSRVSITTDRKRRRSHLINMFSLG